MSSESDGALAAHFRQRPLRERVLHRRAGVVIVDMQNDFCHPDGVFSKLGIDTRPLRAAAEPITRLLGAARSSGLPIIMVRTTHDAWVDPPERYRRPTPEGLLHHLRPGSWGADFYGIVPGDADYIVTKHRYSAFFCTDLAVVIRNRGIETLVVAGVTANVCVESTVRDACALDLDVLVAPECVAAPSSSELHAALYNIDRYFGQVVDLEQLLGVMQSVPSNRGS
jgi:ureidoacrylate peracid hydrolase